jgi:hypothetical protein
VISTFASDRRLGIALVAAAAIVGALATLVEGWMR